MDEADRCDRVALMQRGRVLAIDAPKAITASFGRPLFAVRAANRYGAIRALRAYRNTASVYPFGEALHFVDTHADVASTASRPTRPTRCAPPGSPTPACRRRPPRSRTCSWPDGGAREEPNAPRGNAA
jgi:hypothetical protein